VGTVAGLALIGFALAARRLTPWLAARGISERYVILVRVVLCVVAPWLTYRDLMN
jgi:hypothetical protein